MSDSPPTPPTPAPHRRTTVWFAVTALVLAWTCMAVISQADPWYRNTDMNSHNIIDALAINADVRPKPFDQPALPLKYLLALDYRLRHEVGALPVWNLKRFGRRPDPLQEIPPLVRVVRVHSRMLVILFVLCSAGLNFTVTRDLRTAGFTTLLLCGCTGLLFQGLLIRPELLCVGFGNVLALLCTWRAVAARSWPRHHLWLCLAGLLVGWAMLEKLPGVFYLGLCIGWCWLAALIPAPGPKPDRIHPPYWSGLWPIAGGVAGLGLMLLLGEYKDMLGSVALLRLRVACVTVALLPLLYLAPSRHRGWLFLQDRGRELALLGTGFLASLLLGFLLLRGVMSAANAAEYFTGALRFVIDPAPYMRELLDAKPDTGGSFLTFLHHAPVLYLGITVAVFVTMIVREIPLRLKAFIALLWVGALGITLIMSRRHYAAQYDIFPQVPLLLALSLSLFGWDQAWSRRHPGCSTDWLVPVMLTAGLMLVLSSYFRVQPVYSQYQSDIALPVGDLTLTYLFDHDDHPAAYVKIMQEHYGDREHFAAALARYLADPANRY